MLTSSICSKTSFPHFLISFSISICFRSFTKPINFPESISTSTTINFPCPLTKLTVLEHHPETCSCCGEKLSGEDANPYRHQVVDIPPIKPIVVEHRLHQLMCDNCGITTRAKLPSGVNPSGYETRVVALIAVLSGAYRHSQRMVQSAM